MKNLMTFLVCLWLAYGTFAQDQVIQITNSAQSKSVALEENKRVKIQFADGEKITGRLRMEEDGSVFLNDRPIDLEAIQAMKRNPLLVSALTSGVLIYAGSLAAGIAVITGIFVDSTAYLAILPAVGMIYAGIKSPNLFKKYKREDGWTFQVVPASN